MAFWKKLLSDRSGRSASASNSSDRKETASRAGGYGSASAAIHPDAIASSFREFDDRAGSQGYTGPVAASVPFSGTAGGLRHSYRAADMPQAARVRFRADDYLLRGGYESASRTATYPPESGGYFPMPGCRLSGRFTFAEPARVGGVLEGEVFCSAVMFLEKGAQFQGVWKGNTIVISGYFKGQIMADLVELLPGGVIHGEVKAVKLNVHRGGTLHAALEVAEAA